MNPLNWLKLASLSAALTVLAVLAIFVPMLLWTSASVFAALSCAALIGGLFWITSPGKTGVGNDASALASIGPSSVIAVILIPWSACAIATAVSGQTTMAWGMNVITVGGFILATALSKAASLVIGQQASASAPSMCMQWAAQLNTLAASAQDSPLKTKLSRLSEDLRFAPSDVKGRPVPLDAAIGATFAELALDVDRQDYSSASGHTDQLARLFTSRSAFLQSARSNV